MILKIINKNQMIITYSSRKNYSKLNFIKSELKSPIGDGLFDIFINTNENILTLSRYGYTFENEITALQLGLGNFNKLNFGLKLPWSIYDTVRLRKLNCL